MFVVVCLAAAIVGVVTATVVALLLKYPHTAIVVLALVARSRLLFPDLTAAT